MSNERNNRQPDEEKELRSLLKRQFSPLQNAELERDLWPQMLRRLDAQPEPFRVPWFDWALAAAVTAMLLLFPNVIPALLYQL